MTGDVRDFGHDGEAAVLGISKRDMIVTVVLEPDKRHAARNLVDFELLGVAPRIASRAREGRMARYPALCPKPKTLPTRIWAC